MYIILLHCAHCPMSHRIYTYVTYVIHKHRCDIYCTLTFIQCKTIYYIIYLYAKYVNLLQAEDLLLYHIITMY